MPNIATPQQTTPTVAGGPKRTSQAPVPGVPSKRPSGRVSNRAEREGYREIAREAARRYGVPEELFIRQIQWESGFNPSAVGPRTRYGQAKGIAQIMPSFHPSIDPFNAPAALDYAARLMAGHYREFQDWGLALAAYNAGSGAVRKYKGVPPFAETQKYVRGILGASMVPWGSKRTVEQERRADTNSQVAAGILPPPPQETPVVIPETKPTVHDVIGALPEAKDQQEKEMMLLSLIRLIPDTIKGYLPAKRGGLDLGALLLALEPQPEVIRHKSSTLPPLPPGMTP